MATAAATLTNNEEVIEHKLELESPLLDRELGLSGFVGFDSLPDQLVNKSVDSGFVFNILCIGETGIGKSTLMDSLFNTHFECGSSTHKLDAVDLRTNTYELHEGNINIKLTITETAGYGDQIDKLHSFKPIVDYVDRQYEAYLQEELKIKRLLGSYEDTRVHACLYFISPTGVGLNAMDVECMKLLQHKVNIIPLIAKSDCVSKLELPKFKAKINAELTLHGIKVYQFPIDDESVAELNGSMNHHLPFAVVGSNDSVIVGNKRTRGRQYPWGTVQVENDVHCDFGKLREMLIRTNMEDLREQTHEVHYELYRSARLEEMGFNDSWNESLSYQEIHELSKTQRLKEQRQKEEDMKQEFTQRIKEKEAQLNQSQREIQGKFEDAKESYMLKKTKLEESLKILNETIDEFHQLTTAANKSPFSGDHHHHRGGSLPRLSFGSFKEHEIDETINEEVVLKHEIDENSIEEVVLKHKINIDEETNEAGTKSEELLKVKELHTGGTNEEDEGDSDSKDDDSEDVVAGGQVEEEDEINEDADEDEELEEEEEIDGCVDKDEIITKERANKVHQKPTLNRFQLNIAKIVQSHAPPPPTSLFAKKVSLKSPEQQETKTPKNLSQPSTSSSIPKHVLPTSSTQHPFSKTKIDYLRMISTQCKEIAKKQLNASSIHYLTNPNWTPRDFIESFCTIFKVKMLEMDEHMELEHLANQTAQFATFIKYKEVNNQAKEYRLTLPTLLNHDKKIKGKIPEFDSASRCYLCENDLVGFKDYKANINRHYHTQHSLFPTTRFTCAECGKVGIDNVKNSKQDMIKHYNSVHTGLEFQDDIKPKETETDFDVLTRNMTTWFEKGTSEVSWEKKKIKSCAGAKKRLSTTSKKVENLPIKINKKTPTEKRKPGDGNSSHSLDDEFNIFNKDHDYSAESHQKKRKRRQ